MGQFMGVNTDDPDIVRTTQNIRERGGTKEEAMRIVGMPYEVIDKHWNAAKPEKRTAFKATPKAKRQYTEEQKQAMRDRMAKARAAKKTE